MILNKTLCILIAGKAGTGKTESAKFLDSYLSNFQLKGGIYSFASGVKHCAREYYGWDGLKDERGRRLLQNVGRTGREYNIDIWVNKTLKSFHSSFDPVGDFMLVDDWRYPNELNKVLTDPSLHVITLRIESPMRELLKEGTPEAKDSSETSLPSVVGMLPVPGICNGLEGYRYIINNIGSKQDLYESLMIIADREIDGLKF